MSKRLRLILPVLAVLIVTGVTIAGAMARPNKSAAPATAQKTWRIALSNSFIGNK
jgi:hypothetical protein